MTHWLIGSFGSVKDITDNTSYIESSVFHNFVLLNVVRCGRE